MKYELTNMRFKISDIEYLNDLREVANRLGKKTLKQRDYSKDNGAKYNLKSAISRFGNWNTLLNEAGLEGEKSLKGMEYGEKRIKDEVLIADLVEVANDLNKPNLTIDEYNTHGKFTNVTMGSRFGSWNKAKERAGLKVLTPINNSTEELFQNILDMWTHLGRQPKYGEVIKPQSKFHGATYGRRFGSWTTALNAFIEYVNSENPIEETALDSSHLIPLYVSNGIPNPGVKEIKTKRTSRNINLRLRWKILQRDRFSCRKCGRSPAKDLNVILHVDHIIPWSKDGETLINNLETLCDKCNSGKSNLT